MVFADEVSEEGIKRAVRAGHTYVKVFGAGAPDLRLQAEVPGAAEPPAIMGDTVRAQRAEFTARVIGGGPGLEPASAEAYQPLVVKDGTPVRVVPVTSDDFSLSFVGNEPGRYRLQLQRGSAIEGVTSPIYLEPPPGAGPTASEPSPPRAGDERAVAAPSAERATAAAPIEHAARRTPDRPAGPQSARATDDQGTLPFTGGRLGMAGLVGTALLGMGLRLRRLLR